MNVWKMPDAVPRPMLKILSIAFQNISADTNMRNAISGKTENKDKEGKGGVPAGPIGPMGR